MPVARAQSPARECSALNVCSISVWHLPQVAGTLNLEIGDLASLAGKNLVRAVAIGADRGLRRPLLRRAPVHAVLVGDEGLRALAIRLHQKLLPVAPAAGERNIGVIHRRFGIAARQHLVRAAMAVFAVGRGHLSGLARLGVHAVRVCLLRVCVALRAGHLLRCASRAPGSSHPCGNPRSPTSSRRGWNA